MDATECLSQIDAASAGLLEGLRQPGLAGQTRIHAQLEDLKDALVRVREDGAALPEAEKAAALETLHHCRERLRRADRVFSFIGQMLERQGAASEGAEDYAAATGRLALPWGLRSPRGHGSVEAEG